MQKMQKIGIIVISVLLIGLIIFVALYDSVIDKTVLKINGEKYSIEDFNNYVRLVELEQGENLDIKEMYENYVNTKLYYKKALDYGIVLTEEELAEIDEHYESEEVNKEALAQLGYTKEEYIKYINESTLASKFANEAPDYYPISEEDYLAYKNQMADELKLYNYRILEVYNETPEENADGTVTDEIKQATKTKIEGAADRIKAGEDFETVAKDVNDTYRLISGLSGYTLGTNGQLESIPKMYLEYSVPYEALYVELVELEAGNYTSIIETSAGYAFAKLESVDDELNEESDAAIRNALNAENAENYILATTEIIRNEIKINNVKHVDFEKLPINDTENVDAENETSSISVEEDIDIENAEETENSESETIAE